ncbi:molecular chaperone DnaJ [Altericista sp. CCNU0014]|uniref:molecular chaperone DnaJ n=1 Tax=Altericista sp. CCNU0014 TaxID=3082949 RepID=UPI00384F7A99
MTGEGLVREPSPEERELQKKRTELADLETRLAERELELATFQAELHIFERVYLQVVGMRQQELQRIEAQIEEYMDYLASAHSFKPTHELKQLYRQLAKAIHPDLATEPEARAKRELFMAEANRAYECGDLERLQELFFEWLNCPESIQGEDLAAELIRTVRKIAQSEQRLANIEQKIKGLEKTDIFQLQMKAKRSQQLGRDLLMEMARELDKQIHRAQHRLNELKTRTG